MTERDESRPAADAGDAPEVRIPDGGLGTAMPSWLQQPPAWKREPVKLEAPVRTLPPPDESTIDPATMIDNDDLPAWLRAMARGPEEVSDDPGPTSGDPGPSLEESTVEEPVSFDEVDVTTSTVGQPANLASTEAPAAVQPEPVQPSAVAVESPRREPVDVTTAVPSPRDPEPWWLSERALGALLLLMLVAMIYVVLAASGVV